MFVTSRGMLGYGVSDGAAGNISMRGLSGSKQTFRNNHKSSNKNVR